MTPGENIRSERKKAGLTQKELGALLGVTPQNIAQYETGQRNPKAETIRKIADALQVNVSTLDESYAADSRKQHDDRNPGLKCCIDLGYFDITELYELKLENNMLMITGTTSGGYQATCQIGSAAAKEKKIVLFKNE